MCFTMNSTKKNFSKNAERRLVKLTTKPQTTKRTLGSLHKSVSMTYQYNKQLKTSQASSANYWLQRSPIAVED